MAKINTSQISEAASAMRTKAALEQIEMRNTDGTIPDYTSYTGPRHVAAADSTEKSPLFTQDGKLMTGSLVGGSKQGLFIPKNTKSGTIISYKTGTNNKRFAIVTKKTKGIRPKGYKVKDISTQELKKFQNKHPDAKIVVVDEDSLKNIKPTKNLVLQIFDSIDPTETIFFKIITKSLLGNIFESESVGDMFIILYFRLMFIAAVIIGTTYGLMSLFS